MESMPVNKKVEMLVHRFISTLQKRIQLRKKRMKNDQDDSEGSSDNFPSIMHGRAQADVSPSFDRTPRPSRTSPDEINRQLGPRITNKSMPGQNVVLVRPREQDHSSRQEEIPEEEAVCKFCFNVLKEENVVLKTVCGCKNAFAHEECASNWSRGKGDNNCDPCGQEVQNFPVTLLRGFNSSERIDNQGNKKLLSRSMRFFRCGF